MARRTHFRSIRKFLLAAVAVTISSCVQPQVRFEPGEIPEAKPASRQLVNQAAQFREQVLKTYPVVKSSQYVSRVDRVVGPLLDATTSDAHWNIYILDGGEWNAFTTPGNYIYIFKGLIDSLRSDDELSTVVAHELAHTLADHSTPGREESLGRALSVIASLAAGAALSAGQPGVAASQIETAMGATQAVVQGLAVNPYSQTKEKEADQIGLFLMADAGFNPRAAVDVWTTQAKQSGRLESALAFFSTHPPSGERLERIRSMVPEAMNRYHHARSRGPVRRGSSTHSINR